MFGKLFDSTYRGSMLGAGIHVFAVWGYVIAHTDTSHNVELNPDLVAYMLGCDRSTVESAIEWLCAPDPRSRSHEEEGRRMVQEGPFLYRVVNHAAYRSMRDNDERREYLREKQRESRARKKAKPSRAPTKRQPPSIVDSTPATAMEIVRSPEAPRQPGPWSREACDDWIERFGGTAPGGEIGKSIKPLVDRNTWPVVRQAWRSYLSQTEARFASPSRFAQTYGSWSGGSPDPQEPPPSPDEARRMRNISAMIQGGLDAEVKP